VIYFILKVGFSNISLNCATYLRLKKIAAILLICLLLFNWYGYRFVTNYLQKKADSQLEARLDVNDYAESELIEIRVALNMPYQNNSSSFERHYGEINLDGKIYSYVKRKVEDGYLILKCIPNDLKQQIEKADNILFTINNGLDQEHNGKSNSPLNNVSKSFLTDFDDDFLHYNLKALGDVRDISLSNCASFFHSITLPVSEQPPENFSVHLS
jgi:hypothetical protein